MIILDGTGVLNAIAIGKLKFIERDEISVKRERIADTDKEINRFLTARDKAKEELLALYNKAVHEIGKTDSQIFEIHQMMLDDEDFNDSIKNMILAQKVNAEYAVAKTSDNFAEMFLAMDDDYMKERASDVRDISNRLLAALHGKTEKKVQTDEKHIICADDLVPSETVQLDKSKVLAFVTQKGSKNSHTAILARTMNIPAIIGVGEALSADYEGKLAVVDGKNGKIYIDPDDETLKIMREKEQEEIKKRELLETLKGKDNITKSGKKIKVYANIGGIADVGAALINDAGGIGLFRSEFLYLEQTDYPTEETQFNAYRQVLESMAGKKVIIRTLDIGADKKIDYFNLAPEENPALGYRAIRICLDRNDVFKTQLRALLRASAYGNLSIMFPMIISKEEVLKIKDIVNEVKEELKKENVPYSNDIEMGIMIETPASAIIADILAPEVDFFSVGTNDLTQYTLAADRQNPKVDGFCDTHHKAVLRLIKHAATEAHKNGIWIGICGELASDLGLTQQFIDMGIDELSVSPCAILPLRERIINCD